ncbi:MAG TPA: DUF374 domain-containing protein [Opitutaceae bacterium]|nr:DUF374 domain-containing protein [Opitutaceae bacterium]
MVVWPLAALMRLWAMTIRLSIPEKDRRVISDTAQPTIFVLWHNRLFMVAEIVRRFRGGHPVHGLVSASKDGAWLSAYYMVAGLGAVRGSSSRLGREAATALVGTLRSGDDIGITPDGPRGPVYEMKPGAVIVARRAQARVVLIGMEFESAWRLPSWDGFHVPRPFSRVHMRFEELGHEQFQDPAEDARLLGERLAAMNPDRKSIPFRRRA